MSMTEHFMTLCDYLKDDKRYYRYTGTSWGDLLGEHAGAEFARVIVALDFDKEFLPCGEEGDLKKGYYFLGGSGRICYTSDHTQETVLQRIGPPEDTTPPQLWGEWQTSSWESGRPITNLKSADHKPHLLVYVATQEDEYARVLAGYFMCDDLAVYLNGGARPRWLDRFKRTRETQSSTNKGSTIDAVGPMIARNFGVPDWKQDDSAEERANRKALMDVLFP